jgi:hypothetical protein
VLNTDGENGKIIFTSELLRKGVAEIGRFKEKGKPGEG